MIQRFKILRQNGFLRNIATVATGTAGAQAITMAFAPYITRLYGPEAFGLLGTFVAILAVLAPMAAFTYPLAIVLPKYENDAKGLVKISVLLALGSSCCTMILILCCGNWLSKQLGINEVNTYLWLIPFAMFFSAIHQLLEQWLIRHHQFRITAQAAVFHSTLINSIKAGVGLFYPLASVLIYLQTMTSALYALLLLVSVRNVRIQAAIKERRWGLKKIAMYYRDFPLFRAPQVLINSISQSVPVLTLAGLFGPTAAGLYTLSYMVMGAPSALMGKAVGDVLYPKMTEAMHKKENLATLITRSTVGLFLIGLIPFGLIIIQGPWIFENIFGSDWNAAGKYSQWLAIFFFFNFINKPSVTAFPVLGIQSGLLIYEVFSTGIKIAGLLTGFYYFNNETMAVALFSVAGAAAYCAMILWIIFRARRLDNAEAS